MPPQPNRQSLHAQESDGSEEDEILDESEHSEDDSDQELLATSPQKGKYTAQGSNIIVETSFDAYFTHIASRAQTSSNVFSNLILPLTAEEYNDAIAAAKPGLKTLQPAISTPQVRNALFSRFLIELQEGFNILCYGYGSKRQPLNQFATEFCSKRGHVVITNGFQPDFAIKDLLNQIENVPGIQDTKLSSPTPEERAQRISKFFSQPPSKKRQPHLYLIIHNIDTAVLRTPRAKSILSLLALTPNIHITASIDHINSPLIWSSSECSTRKRSPTSHSFSHQRATPSAESSTTIPSRGFSWLYHDLTTLVPYDFELAYVDRTSLTSAHGGGPRKKVDLASALPSTLNPSSSLPGGGITNMSETAALHVLASVTQKAQKLFILLANKQLETIEEADASGPGSGGAAVDLQATAIGYDALFNLARSDFIATNDTALRALLGEFRDHGLIVSGQGGLGSGGEILWIPLRRERLASVLQNLQKQV